MKILALSWRDIKHPKAGGAEVYTHEMLAGMVASGMEVVHIGPKVKDLPADEHVDGVVYRRRAGTFTVILYVFLYILFFGKGFDFIIDQASVHRFFTPLYVAKKKRIFFIHQLIREIWFYRMFFPINYLGYYFENALFWPYRNTFTWTVSPSTRNDLVRLGFRPKNIEIIPEGIHFTPWNWEKLLPKYSEFTFLYVGRFVKYKGIDDTVEAFGRLVQGGVAARLKIVGKIDEEYKKNHLDPVMSKYDCFDRIDFLGFQSEESKLEIMSRSHVIVVASIREGWGLIITESNAVGTPALVYDSPGLVDAVKINITGLVVQPNVDALVTGMKKYMENQDVYATMRKSAWEDSFQYHWDETGRAACESLHSRFNAQ